MHNGIRRLTLGLALGCGVFASGIGAMGTAAQDDIDPCVYDGSCSTVLFPEERYPGLPCLTDICGSLNQPPLGDSVLVVPKEGRDYPYYPRP